MAELEQYIRHYFGLPQDDLALVSSLFKFEQLNKGDYLVREGDYCNRMSFISHGICRVFAIRGDKEITQWLSTPGYFVTELGSLIFNQPARFSIQAITDVQLFTLYRDDYNKIGTLIAKWPELEKLFLAKCFITMEDRIFAHLSMNAEERYQQFFLQHKELFNQVPLQYIASMLGMTPETFSRIRAKNPI